jgi:hypothetical protein
MIAYEILVQTIADWKAGVRPTAPTPPVPRGAPESVEDVESGVVDFDEQSYEAYEVEGEQYEDDGQYQQQELGGDEQYPSATDTYDDR